jgi:hypothetical protein
MDKIREGDDQLQYFSRVSSKNYPTKQDNMQLITILIENLLKYHE